MPPVTPPDYPMVNGHRHDWASVLLEFAGLKIRGFKAISYKHGLDYSHVMASGVQPVGDTLGTYSAEGSFEMLIRDYQLLVQALGDGYMAKHFLIVAKYSKKAGDTIQVDELRGCRIKSEDRSFSQGNEALVVKVDLGIQLLLINGIKAVPDMIGV